MGLLKKPKKKKPLRTTGGAAATQASTLRPQQIKKIAPCGSNCPSGNKIREWIQIIAQRDKMKVGEEEAFTRAWKLLVETNPFPAVMGRVCPHPCEDDCNRVDKDGAVSINALERFIGDWALEKGLALSKIEGEGPKEESIGVIGSGPAGLSFAYQLARRGYPVTVYEKTDKAGGMLYWGIPFYRLPADVLEKEIRRIVDLGVELKLNTCVGEDISVDEIKQKHKVLFLGVGAHKGRLLKVPGEEGPRVWTGTEYLYRVNNGEKVDVGKKVAVIGGGDTAIDAARAARRAGAKVTILYRRTRVEAPAIDSEIEDALKEGVEIQFLVAPVELKRDGDQLKAVVVQKMELGEPDDSGRRRPVPIEGSEYEIPIDSLIAAISQEPDWDPLPGLGPEGRWLEADERGKVRDCVYSGGDALNLGLATIAVGQGRQAALAVHAELRGTEPPPLKPDLPMVDKKRIKLDVDVYEAKPRAERAHRPAEEWLSKSDEEIDLGITREQFLDEVARCFSCGNCFGCERCWMFCTPGCFKKVDSPGPGNYYTIKLDTCDGCKKCEDECPCGFIDMR
jgi:NADPH-dependent glutamate synthase beta subunit-like oxidoreductase/Pyruvate/2-oxoacid:ferredoxin oxidoreductase delta subunit